MMVISPPSRSGCGGWGGGGGGGAVSSVKHPSIDNIYRRWVDVIRFRGEYTEIHWSSHCSGYVGPYTKNCQCSFNISTQLLLCTCSWISIQQRRKSAGCWRSFSTSESMVRNGCARTSCNFPRKNRTDYQTSVNPPTAVSVSRQNRNVSHPPLVYITSVKSYGDVGIAEQQKERKQAGMSNDGIKLILHIRFHI